MTVNRVPALRTMIRAPLLEAVFLSLRPLEPTEMETITTSLSSFGGSGDVGAVSEDSVGVTGGVVGVEAGTSLAPLAGPGAGSATTGGIPSETFSKYHAATKPSCPCAVRTRSI